MAQPAFAETSVWDGSMVRPSQGTGSAEDPFLINTAEEMAYLIQNYDYNSGIYYRKYYKLTRDLDMKSTQWTFGSANNDRKSFRAHFDGAGHKISNIEITIQDSPKETHYGMFPQLGGDDEFESVIENLEISNIHFVRSAGDANGTYNFRIGGLVGQMYKNSRISNCLVHGYAVTDYGPEVNMRDGSRISSCPLVGEIQHKFGETETYHKERSTIIETCYGRGTSDLSHFHGKKKGQVFSTDVQGRYQPHGFSYNGYVWYTIGEDDCSFTMTNVDIIPAMSGNKFQYECYFNRERGHTYTYRWLLDGKRVGTNTSAVTTVQPKPYVQRLDLTVFDNGVQAGSGAILIEPDRYNIAIESITDIDDNTHKVVTKMTTDSGLDVDEKDFDFSWVDMTDDEKEVATTSTLDNALDGHTYMLIASHRKHKSAKFSIVQSFSKPIYVCNQGISEFEASHYTLNGESFKKGSDGNDGLTPETAVRTLKRAYELLSSPYDGGSVGKNVIIIMGDYGDYDFTEYLDNKCTRRNPDYFVKDRPALICGRSGKFRNGRLLFAGLSIKIMADTRFEQINLHGTSFEITEPTDAAKVYACGNNLTMGYGILINGYRTMDYTLGMSEGIFVPTITLYGGVLNNDDPNYEHKENTITIHSGTYGRIIAGDGYTLQMERTNNISGNPDSPVRTRIVCDVANYYDPYHSQYDVALIIGGQADGTVFADTKIDVKGTSRIGRIVGGNVAFGRAIPDRPADSFFGQTNVTLYDGDVAEIFGTNLGRYGHILYPDEMDHDSCVTYFYGRSKIDILGGSVHNSLYGGGAADVVGYSYDKNHHTWDPYVPYMKAGLIKFGDYETAHGRLPIVKLRDGELDLNKTELQINISGDARIRCSVYGGSNSYSSLLPTRQAGSQSGCIFGDTYINVTGGVIDGYIHGGCQGNLSYFENSDNSTYPIVNGELTDKMYFTHMGQMFGNSHINISGGEVKGLIFAGGEGTYYRATSEEDPTNAVDMIGSTFGSTSLKISGEALLHEYAFGGGNYAHILRTGEEDEPAGAGCTNISISGGKLYGAVFGGGHGNRDQLDDARSIYARVDGDTHIDITGGQFFLNEAYPRYINRRVYGLVAGGIATSTVCGNTFMKVTVDPFPKALRNNKNIVPEEDLLLIPGGYDKDCVVRGTANFVAQLDSTSMVSKLYAGGVNGSVGNANFSLLSGKIKEIFAAGRNADVNGESIITIGSENDALHANDSIKVDKIHNTGELSGKINNEEGVAKIIVHGGTVKEVL